MQQERDAAVVTPRSALVTAQTRTAISVIFSAVVAVSTRHSSLIFMNSTFFCSSFVSYASTVRLCSSCAPNIVHARHSERKKQEELKVEEVKVEEVKEEAVKEKAVKEEEEENENEEEGETLEQCVITPDEDKRHTRDMSSVNHTCAAATACSSLTHLSLPSASDARSAAISLSCSATVVADVAA